MRPRASIFRCASIDDLPLSLAKHLHSHYAQTAYFNEEKKCYEYEESKGSPLVRTGGLLSLLHDRYYPRFNEKQKGGKSKLSGLKRKRSTAKQGKRVDTQIAESIENPKIKRPHKMTKKLLEHWKELRHKLVAAQVPVLVQPEGRMTQADLITTDAAGRVHLYEIKTGSPAFFDRPQKTQKNFSGMQFSHVQATKLNIWHLQLAYTRMALEQAKVKIDGAHIIQIYEEKGSDNLKIKVYEPPEWISKLLPKGTTNVAEEASSSISLL